MFCRACQESDLKMTLNAPLLILISVIRLRSAEPSALLAELNEAIETVNGEYQDSIFINKVGITR